MSVEFVAAVLLTLGRGVLWSSLSVELVNELLWAIDNQLAHSDACKSEDA